MSGKGRKREAKKELAKPYEPTPHELAAMEAQFNDTKARQLCRSAARS